MYVYLNKLNAIITNYYRKLIKDKNAIINIDYYPDNSAMFAHISIQTNKKLKRLESEFYLDKYELNLIINSYVYNTGFVSTGFDYKIIDGKFISISANISPLDQKIKTKRRKL